MKITEMEYQARMEEYARESRWAAKKIEELDLDGSLDIMVTDEPEFRKAHEPGYNGVWVECEVFVPYDEE